MPKLFLVHCGFATPGLSGGVFEPHVDLFVAAEDFDDARARAKALSEFKAHKMHVDGLIEISQVEGYRVELKKTADTETKLKSQKGFAFRGKKKAL
jgi:hypothetical protein